MSQLEQFPGIRLRAIPITGPDAVVFMQAQLTVDIHNIADQRLHPTAWCSPDGRVDTVLLVALEAGRVTLVLPETMVEATLKRARMFSIGRKVTIEQTSSVHPAGHTSPDPDRELALAFDPARALVIDDAAENPDDRATELSAEWLQADVQCRMPWILPENAGLFLPQMLGMEALGGLSYKKGCFPGQEVIARVHYRGRVTRRITGFRLQADRPPAPGTEFELAGKPARVLYAVAGSGPATAVAGLAVVAAEARDDAEIS
ncbi:MAG: hypothetical protein WD397_03495, partial [Wenzhouxiangellaceae bacterium]